MARACDALILSGPPGLGKSFLGNRLAREGIAEYQQVEPALCLERLLSRQRFDLRIDGTDVVSAAAAIRSFLKEPR